MTYEERGEFSRTTRHSFTNCHPWHTEPRRSDAAFITHLSESLFCIGIWNINEQIQSERAHEQQTDFAGGLGDRQQLRVGLSFNESIYHDKIHQIKSRAGNRKHFRQARRNSFGRDSHTPDTNNPPDNL